MFNRIFYALIALWVAGPAFAQNVTGNVIPPGANSQTITPTYVNVSYYGALCNGTTDDSAAFTLALVANNVFVGPAPSTCIVKNLVVSDRETLDCRGAVLQAAPGANWIVKKTGFASYIRNCIIYDPTNITMASTTLTADAAPQTNLLTVANATAFQVNQIASVQLSSGAYWVSKITAVNAVANTITIADQIPYSVTGFTIASGGTGWLDGNIATMTAGTGPPATAKIAATAGVVTGLTINAPGLYQANPGTPVGFYDPKSTIPGGLSVNATYAGAVTGGFVDAAFGAVMDDNADGGVIENITVSAAPVAFEFLASSGQTTEESVRGIYANASPLVGFARLSGVHDNSFTNVVLSGRANHASAYGSAGVYLEATNRSYPNGGNVFDISALGFETGMIDNDGQLDTFTHANMDTNRNYGFVCIGCQYTDFPYLWASFTGPNVIGSLGGTAGGGVGAYFGSGPAGPALNNTIGMFETSYNASDLHFGDGVGYLLVGKTWGPSKLITAVPTGALSLGSVSPLMSITPAAVGGLSTPQYLGPGQVSSTQTPSSIAGIKGTETQMFVTSSIAPGAATYTAYGYINHWNGTSYLGWNSFGNCSWTGTATACTYAYGGAYVNQQDLLDIAVITSGATFVANQTISATILGQ